MTLTHSVRVRILFPLPNRMSRHFVSQMQDVDILLSAKIPYRSIEFALLSKKGMVILSYVLSALGTDEIIEYPEELYADDYIGF